MATSAIRKEPLTFVNLTSLQDAVDVIGKIDGGESLLMHSANACTKAILGSSYNFQAMGIVSKVSTATADFLDMLFIGPAEGYWYVARIDTSGATTLKRRVTANTF